MLKDWLDVILKFILQNIKTSKIEDRYYIDIFEKKINVPIIWFFYNS